MVGQEPYPQSVFPEPPLVAYQRQKNNKKSIIREKVAPARQQWTKTGLQKCGKYLARSYVKQGKVLKARTTQEKLFFVENRKISFMS